MFPCVLELCVTGRPIVVSLVLVKLAPPVLMMLSATIAIVSVWMGTGSVVVGVPVVGLLLSVEVNVWEAESVVVFDVSTVVSVEEALDVVV